MSAEAAELRMTYAEYCALEREAKVKHEYVTGEVFAMTSGTLEHGRLAFEVGYRLKLALDGGPCGVFSSDVRVRIEKIDVDVYPDLSVYCGEAQTSEADEHALLNPTLIVEVLSRGTEAYDRGDKASYYRRIPSLQAYLFVAQDRPHLELYVRAKNHRWVLVEAGPGEALAIEPLGVELDVDAIYREAIPRKNGPSRRASRREGPSPATL